MLRLKTPAAQPTQDFTDTTFTEPSGETPDGSSVSTDQSTADLEADLLNTNQSEPAVDGTEMNTTATDTTVPTDGTEAPAEGGEEDPVKSIQKLTGKLSQQIRDTQDKLEPEDIKYTLNSIISATDINKLSDEDKTDIMNKIENKDQEPQEEVPTETPAEEPVTEGEDGDSESNFYESLLSDKTVMHILDMADLNYEMRNNPEEIAFDFCEAAYVFIHDYNDSNEFIQKLKTLLNENQFKARPSLNSKDDLEYFGDKIYDALVKHETEHDGEVLMEQRIISILERARQNVKNNLNKQ